MDRNSQNRGRQTAEIVTIDAPLLATSGTLRPDQVGILTKSEANPIYFNGNIFRLSGDFRSSGFLDYVHVDDTGIEIITVTIATGGWVRTERVTVSGDLIDLTDIELPTSGGSDVALDDDNPIAAALASGKYDNVILPVIIASKVSSGTFGFPVPVKLLAYMFDNTTTHVTYIIPSAEYFAVGGGGGYYWTYDDDDASFGAHEA